MNADCHGFHPRSSAPDVLVVDWLLAGPMDGLELIEAVRVANPRLQSVVITGCLSAEVEARIKALPGAQYLAKPFVPGCCLTIWACAG